MQHYGKRHDEDGVLDLSEEVAMEKITATLKDVKVQYKEAEKALKGFYAEGGEDEEEEEDEEEDEGEEAEGDDEEEAEEDGEGETEEADAATEAETEAAAK